MDYVVKGKIRGRVQGVGFRNYIKKQAEQRGVTGVARNLPDGTVELILQGNREHVNKLQLLASIGPESADVRGLNWEFVPALAIEAFEIE